MKYRCLELIVLITFLESNNAKNYNEVYIEPACQHNSTIVFGLGTSENSTLILKNRKEYGYGAHNDCNVTISTNSIKNGHVMLNIRRIDFNHPEYCENYIEIFNGSSFVDKICGNFDYTTSIISFTIPREYFAKLHYHTVNSSSSHSGFEIVATAYTNGPCQGEFNFQCDSYICISSSLRCDGYNNCGDRSDERSCNPPPRGSDNAVIIAVAVVVLLLVLLAVAIIWRCRKNRGEHILRSNTNYQTFSIERLGESSTKFPVFETNF